MKKLVSVMTIGFLVCVGIEARAGKAIKCSGEESAYQFVTAFFNGEGEDTLDLDVNSVYGIHNSSSLGEPLVLSRSARSRTSGVYADFPIQFEITQVSDLGRSQTIFAVELGSFGGRIGHKFDAVLSTSRVHKLKCEIVPQL